MSIEQLLTVRQSAMLLAISPGTMAKWLSNGRVQRVKVGGATRIRSSEIEALIRDGARDEARAARCKQVGLSNKEK